MAPTSSVSRCVACLPLPFDSPRRSHSLTNCRCVLPAVPQEVDDEQYHDCFLANLSKEGYEGAFFPKTRARTMTSDEKKHVDGCATFWKSSKWVSLHRSLACSLS